MVNINTRIDGGFLEYTNYIYWVIDKIATVVCVDLNLTNETRRGSLGIFKDKNTYVDCLLGTVCYNE